MLRHPAITRQRITAARALVEAAIETATQPLRLSAWHVDGEPVPAERAWDAVYEDFALGSEWGPAWTTTWFRAEGTIPAAWSGGRVDAAFDITGTTGVQTGFTGEGLVYRDRRPLQGISPNHHRVALSASTGAEERVLLFIEGAANPDVQADHSLLLARSDPRSRPLFRFVRADLVLVDTEVENVAHDLRILDQLLDTIDEGEPRYGRLLLALNDVCNVLDARDVRGSLGRVRTAYHEVITSPAVPSAHRVTAVGHAHIDSAWLWPVRESKRKVARTFTTALALMEQYPDYRFAASQAAQYEWMRTEQPELFARIRERVAAGQWEPVGSLWVEADCNISSGESLVRQLLYGKRWFREHFGIETRDVFLPDVFGYAANLPQLFRKAGIDFFLTQKLSWNQFNRLPSNTFWWEGIDGSRVLTHFPPADTYNGSFDVREVVQSARWHRDQGRSDQSLYLFGHGDGGGGPTAEMIESARRLDDLEGAPRVRMGSVRDAIEAMHRDSRDLTTWVGELYFELHRGTYTTQARTKLGNRRCESLLRDAELLSVVTGHRSGADDEVLARSWRTVLFNQFHDIIPGSSIDWVYEETERDYANVQREAGAIRDARLAALSRGDEAHPQAWTVVNTAAGARRAVVALPLGAGDIGGRCVAGTTLCSPLQEADVDGQRVALAVVDAPGCGSAVVTACEASPLPSPAPARATTSLLENDVLAVRFDADGLIESIHDKRSGREVVAPGARANVLRLHEDRPAQWEAWDIDLPHRETFTEVTALESTEVVADGPVRATIRQVRRFGASRVTQDISLDAGSDVIRFATDVDWQESQRILKVAFAVDVVAPHATYEVQFGTVERPTHFNTSWDTARFEVCAHRWADLSDARHGVTLLNDSKYGHDIHGNVMCLSLLRAPTFPDPTADRGRQLFTYALKPHEGDWRGAGVIEAADDLNNPLRAVVAPADAVASSQSWLHIEGEGVALSAMKWAEDSDDVVVRVFETFGGATTARLHTTIPSESAAVTDLLEQPVEALEVEDGDVTLRLGAYEVVSVILRR